MISKEFIEKAKACSTREELVKLASDEGVKLSQGIINGLFPSNQNSELSDEELGNVTGGTCYGDGWDGKSRPIVTDANVCGLYSAIGGHVEFPAICPNCCFYSGRVNGVTISAMSAYCTNDQRIEGNDIINQ